MIEPGSPDPAATLLEALAEAARLLEEGDSEGAARAMASVVGRCPEVSSGGLGAEEVTTARRLLERCRAAEAQLRRHVTDEIAKLSSSRRAHTAYQR